MSIILDALRRGRGRRRLGPSPNAAQTDAVLQTLGYGRFNPASPINRLKRALAPRRIRYPVAVVLWVAVIWMTAHVPLARRAVRTTRSDARPCTAAPAPTSDRKRTDAPQATTQPPTHSAARCRTQAPAAADACHTCRRTRITRTRRTQRTYAPATHAPGAIRVQTSRRVGLPTSAPIAPAARRRTAMSTSAARSAATVTTGDDHFSRAMMYQRLGDFENALVSYRQVLQRDDLNVEAHNNLGVLYRDKGLFDDAIKAVSAGDRHQPRLRARAQQSRRRLSQSAEVRHGRFAISRGARDRPEERRVAGEPFDRRERVGAPRSGPGDGSRARSKSIRATPRRTTTSD